MQVKLFLPFFISSIKQLVLQAEFYQKMLSACANKKILSSEMYLTNINNWQKKFPCSKLRCIFPIRKTNKKMSIFDWLWLNYKNSITSGVIYYQQEITTIFIWNVQFRKLQIWLMNIISDSYHNCIVLFIQCQHLLIPHPLSRN